MKNKEFKQLQKGFKLAFKMLDKIIEAKKIHVEELKLLEKALASKLPAVGINKKYPDGGDTAVGVNKKVREISEVGARLAAAFSPGDGNMPTHDKVVFPEDDIQQLQTKVHKITGDGEVMKLFNELLGIQAG